MAILRLKQAQHALTDGRLDEAFDLAQSDSLASHQQGQKLLTDLSERLSRRGRDHLEAGRMQEASADCEKAAKLAGNLDEIAELRRDICNQVSQNRKDGSLQGAHLVQAQRHIENGRLSAGQKILEGLTGDHAAELLKLQARAKRLELEDALQKASRALDGDDIEEAINIILRTSPVDRSDAKLAEVITIIKGKSKKVIRENLNAGRVDLAESLLLKIETFVSDSIELEDFQRTVEQCHTTAKWLQQGRPREAIAAMEQMKTRLPDARWIAETLQTIREVADGLDSALAGPLGLVGGQRTRESEVRSQLIASPDRQGGNRKGKGLSRLPMEAGDESTNVLPGMFVLQIDGVGSYLVVRNARVSIGPISHTQRPEIGLVTQPDCPVAMIERNDGDYFIRSSVPIGLNDDVMKNKLLTEGDRVTLSNRCRFKFSRPNPASGTARLALSSARLPNPDIRQVILMDREIIIADNSAAHIQTADCPEKIVLVLNGEQLMCQSSETVEANGQQQERNEGCPIGQNLQIGQLSLVIREV